MAEATKVVTKKSVAKVNHNKQTYLSKEDRVLMIRLVNVEIEKAMEAKLTPQSIRGIAVMQDLITKLEAKLNA